jgi:hypothetical protein
MRISPQLHRGPAAARSAAVEQRRSAISTQTGAASSELAKGWISSDHARGGLGPDEGSSGDTLLPMLIGALVLIVIGIGAVLLLV